MHRSSAAAVQYQHSMVLMNINRLFMLHLGLQRLLQGPWVRGGLPGVCRLRQSRSGYCSVLAFRKHTTGVGISWVVPGMGLKSQARVGCGDAISANRAVSAGSSTVLLRSRIAGPYRSRRPVLGLQKVKIRTSVLGLQRMRNCVSVLEAPFSWRARALLQRPWRCSVHSSQQHSLMRRSFCCQTGPQHNR